MFVFCSICVEFISYNSYVIFLDASCNKREHEKKNIGVSILVKVKLKELLRINLTNSFRLSLRTLQYGSGDHLHAFPRLASSWNQLRFSKDETVPV